MKLDSTLKDLLKVSLNNGTIPMLLGEPGIGKSSFVEGFARDYLGTKCFTFACNQLGDKSDVTGTRLIPVTRTIKKADGTTEDVTDYKQESFPHAVIYNAIEYALNNPRETPILFLDELNRTSSDVTSELLSIPTLRQIGKEKLPENLKVITAGNDKGNITALDQASISRFIKLYCRPSLDTFLSVNPDLNQYIKKVLMDNPSDIFCKDISATPGYSANDDDEDLDLLDEDDMCQITTPRTITALSKYLNSIGENEILALINEPSDIDEEISVMEEIVVAHIGKTALTVHLMSELSTIVYNNSNQSQIVMPPKPVVYDDLLKATSMTDLENIVANFTENEKSQSLVYALAEKKDNSNIIPVLANSIINLDMDSEKRLANILTNNTIDKENFQIFLNVNNDFTNKYNLFRWILG